MSEQLKFIYSSGTCRNIIALGSWTENNDEEKCLLRRGKKGEQQQQQVRTRSRAESSLKNLHLEPLKRNAITKNVRHKLNMTVLINDEFALIKCIPEIFVVWRKTRAGPGKIFL